MPSKGAKEKSEEDVSWEINSLVPSRLISFLFVCFISIFSLFDTVGLELNISKENHLDFFFVRGKNHVAQWFNL